MKVVRRFEASDGKLFKQLKDLERHERFLAFSKHCNNLKNEFISGTGEVVEAHILRSWLLANAAAVKALLEITGEVRELVRIRSDIKIPKRYWYADRGGETFLLLSATVTGKYRIELNESTSVISQILTEHADLIRPEEAH